MPEDIEAQGSPPLTEVGVIADLPFSGSFTDNELAWPADALELELVDRMLARDGQARTLLSVMTLPLRSATPMFTPMPAGGIGRGSRGGTSGGEPHRPVSARAG